jgi:hydrogenase/urease accessory protein HupE
MSRSLRALLAGGLLALSAPAFAHLMPAQQGTINLVEDKAFVLVSVPVSTLGGDDNGDGLLSKEELRAHLPALRQRAADGFRLRDGEANAEPLVLQLIAEKDHEQAVGARHVVLMGTFQFVGSPAQPRVETNLFGPHDDERMLSLRVQRGTQIEPVVLTPLRPAQGLFQPAWRAAVDYVQLGAEHILLGFDHLLFLLTVLAVGAGWRYWLTVVTSFTLAHSVTLALAALGWVVVPPAVAEPLIAASIILMALDNLRRGAVPLRGRAALVFACGLVHGLGFASALRELGGRSVHWLNLAAFNAGVELGQLLFVGAALTLLMGVRRFLPEGRRRPEQAISWAAAALGTLLLGRLLVA